MILARNYQEISSPISSGVIKTVDITSALILQFRKAKIKRKAKPRRLVKPLSTFRVKLEDEFLV